MYRRGLTTGFVCTPGREYCGTNTYSGKLGLQHPAASVGCWHHSMAPSVGSSLLNGVRGTEKQTGENPSIFMQWHGCQRHFCHCATGRPAILRQQQQQGGRDEEEVPEVTISEEAISRAPRLPYPPLTSSSSPRSLHKCVPYGITGNMFDPFTVCKLRSAVVSHFKRMESELTRAKEEGRRDNQRAKSSDHKEVEEKVSSAAAEKTPTDDGTESALLGGMWLDSALLEQSLNGSATEGDSHRTDEDANDPLDDDDDHDDGTKSARNRVTTTTTAQQQQQQQQQQQRGSIPFRLQLLDGALQVTMGMSNRFLFPANHAVVIPRDATTPSQLAGAVKASAFSPFELLLKLQIPVSAADGSLFISACSSSSAASSSSTASWNATECHNALRVAQITNNYTSPYWVESKWMKKHNCADVFQLRSANETGITVAGKKYYNASQLIVTSWFHPSRCNSYVPTSLFSESFPSSVAQTLKESNFAAMARVPRLSKHSSSSSCTRGPLFSSSTWLTEDQAVMILMNRILLVVNKSSRSSDNKRTPKTAAGALPPSELQPIGRNRKPTMHSSSNNSSDNSKITSVPVLLTKKQKRDILTNWLTSVLTGKRTSTGISSLKPDEPMSGTTGAMTSPCSTSSRLSEILQSVLPTYFLRPQVKGRGRVLSGELSTYFPPRWPPSSTKPDDEVELKEEEERESCAFAVELFNEEEVREAWSVMQLSFAEYVRASSSQVPSGPSSDGDGVVELLKAMESVSFSVSPVPWNSEQLLKFRGFEESRRSFAAQSFSAASEATLGLLSLLHRIQASSRVETLDELALSIKERVKRQLQEIVKKNYFHSPLFLYLEDVQVTGLRLKKCEMAFEVSVGNSSLRTGGNQGTVVNTEPRYKRSLSRFTNPDSDDFTEGVGPEHTQMSVEKLSPGAAPLWQRGKRRFRKQTATVINLEQLVVEDAALLRDILSNPHTIAHNFPPITSDIELIQMAQQVASCRSISKSHEGEIASSYSVAKNDKRHEGNATTEQKGSDQVVGTKEMWSGPHIWFPQWLIDAAGLRIGCNSTKNDEDALLYENFGVPQPVTFRLRLWRHGRDSNVQSLLNDKAEASATKKALEALSACRQAFCQGAHGREEDTRGGGGEGQVMVPRRRFSLSETIATSISASHLIEFATAPIEEEGEKGQLPPSYDMHEHAAFRKILELSQVRTYYSKKHHNRTTGPPPAFHPSQGTTISPHDGLPREGGFGWSKLYHYEYLVRHGSLRATVGQENGPYRCTGQSQVRHFLQQLLEYRPIDALTQESFPQGSLMNAQAVVLALHRGFITQPVSGSLFVPREFLLRYVLDPMDQQYLMQSHHHLRHAASSLPSGMTMELDGPSCIQADVSNNNTVYHHVSDLLLPALHINQPRRNFSAHRGDDDAFTTLVKSHYAASTASSSDSALATMDGHQLLQRMLTDLSDYASSQRTPAEESSPSVQTTWAWTNVGTVKMREGAEGQTKGSKVTRLGFDNLLRCRRKWNVTDSDTAVGKPTTECQLQAHQGEAPSTIASFGDVEPTLPNIGGGEEPFEDPLQPTLTNTSPQGSSYGCTQEPAWPTNSHESL